MPHTFVEHFNPYQEVLFFAAPLVSPGLGLLYQVDYLFISLPFLFSKSSVMDLIKIDLLFKNYSVFDVMNKKNFKKISKYQYLT